MHLVNIIVYYILAYIVPPTTLQHGRTTLSLSSKLVTMIMFVQFGTVLDQMCLSPVSQFCHLTEGPLHQPGHLLHVGHGLDVGDGLHLDHGAHGQRHNVTVFRKW